MRDRKTDKEEERERERETEKLPLHNRQHRLVRYDQGGRGSEKRSDLKEEAAISCRQQALGGDKGDFPEGVQAIAMSRSQYEKSTPKHSTGCFIFLARRPAMK